MRKTLHLTVSMAVPMAILFAGLVPAARFARAEEPKPAATAPKLATDEAAAAAIEKFKEAWKATGLKGEEKTSQRDFAMAQVSRVFHKTVVDALATVARGSDETLRMIAVAYLGDQRLLAGYTGPRVSAAMKANPKDDVLLMTGLQSMGSLKWLGGREDIKAGLKHTNYAIKKTAIQSVGQTGDLRLLPDVLNLVGMNIGKDGGVPPDSSTSSGKTEETKGYSWSGAEASVDTGTEGDGDQKAAEAKAKAQIAANKAAAGGSSGGGTPSASGDTGGGAGPGGGRGGASRNPQELIPAVLGTLKVLTGETFKGPKEVREWLKAHQKDFQDRCAKLDEAEKAQAAAAAAK